MIDARTLAVTFSGLFLWYIAPEGGAIYCQLTQAAGKVQGECRALVPDGSRANGLESKNLSVSGETDGRRVILSQVGIFGINAPWGTATLNGSGFELEVSSDRIRQLQFRRVGATQVNASIAMVEREGRNVRAAFLYRQSLLKAKQDTESVRNDLANMRSRLSDWDHDIVPYVEDSAAAFRNLAEAREYALIMRDSLRRFGDSFGFLEARTTNAQGRVEDRKRNLNDRSRLLSERRLERSKIVDQINRDLAYLAGRN